MTIEIKKISKNFGGLKALDECSLIVKRGKIVAIIGPNGSGKSTLFNVISRLVKESGGRVLLGKKDLTGMKDFEVAKRGIARTFQEARVFANLTIREHLEIAFAEENENLLKSVFWRKKNYEKKIKGILDSVGLVKELETLATDLSYGQRKLLGLAVAIAKPHKILMLDEPVAGVNPALREEIKKILLKLNEDRETILLIEHDMNFVMEIAHYVYVLDYGKVIASGTPHEIKNNDKVLEAYLGK